MRGRVLSLIGAAALLGTVVAAQTPAGQPPAKTGEMATPSAMTISGCLKGATNPTLEMKGTIYTLQPIEKAAAPSPSAATGTARPAATAAAAPATSKTGSTYTLVAAEAIGLDKHVGHLVELTGQLSTPPPSPARTPGEAQTQKPPAPGGAHNTFEVSALKMVAASCP